MKNILKFYEKGSVEILYGKSSHCFPLHSHESFCVGAVTDGEVMFTINGDKRLLKQPSIFIIPSNTGVKIATESQYNYITICFKDKLKDQVNSIAFNNYFVNLKTKEDILVLCNTFMKNNDGIQLLDSILNLINSATSPLSLTENTQPDEIISSVCEYIKLNAIQKFNLDELAKSFFVSKYHLIRIFKREMGVTPHQYYIQAKMRIIKSQIFHEQSETNLAADLNLSDESHLCKLFKKQMGISFQDYKKNLIRN